MVEIKGRFYLLICLSSNPKRIYLFLEKHSSFHDFSNHWHGTLNIA